MEYSDKISNTPIEINLDEVNKTNIYVDVTYITFQGIKQKCFLKHRYFKSDAYFYECPETGKNTFFCKVSEAEKVETNKINVGIKPLEKGISYFEKLCKSKINSSTRRWRRGDI